MSIEQDEAKRLRIRDIALDDGFSQTGRDPSLGMPSMVAQTKQVDNYPSSALQFYACAPITVLGNELEGGAGSSTLGASTFFALNLGSAVPPNGTTLIVTFVESRWVFRYDG